MDAAVAIWCGAPSRERDSGSSSRTRLVVVHADEEANLEHVSDDDAIDRMLFERIRDNDSAALGTLLDRHAAMLARNAAMILGSTDQAQDVVQEVFIRLWNLRLGTTLHGSVVGYLVRMTRNRAVSLLRHERSVARAAQAAYVEEVGVHCQVHNSGEAGLERAELARVIRDAIADLPARTREVFLLRRQARMSAAAVADALGISRETVHVTLSRALRRIAERVAAELG